MAVSQDQAVSFWIERAQGRKIREICADHNVDPRRLYEVFEGEVHPDSLANARTRLAKEAPHLLNSDKLKPHQPSRVVVKKSMPTGQGSLF